MTDTPTGNIITDNAIGAYETFITMSSGKHPESNRAQGIILTQSQIVAIRKYAYKAIRLPTSMVDVKAYLNFNVDAGIGNKPEDFRGSFIIIHNHAKRWDRIYRDIKLVTTELKLFGAKMIIYGNAMDRIIGEIKAANILKGLGIRSYADLAAAKITMGTAFPDLTLDAEDLQIAATFGECISIMLRGVTAQHRKAQAINDALSSFANDLANNVQQQISTRLAAVDAPSLNAKVKALTDKIAERAVAIDEKTKEYKSAVEKSLSAAAGLNLFGLGMAIYIGVEAEKIRKERNALSDLQQADISLLEAQEQTLGRLAQIKLDLQNLDTLIFSADKATKNLVSVWDSITLYAQSSKEATEEITDGMSAIMFSIEFALVVEPWKQMSNDVEDLQQVFIDADTEFNQIYQP
jgi:hypothetical protein